MIDEPPQWRSEPMSQLPNWAEPLVNRHVSTNFSVANPQRLLECSYHLNWGHGLRPILGNRKSHYYDSFLDEPDSATTTDDLLWYDTQHGIDPQSPLGVSQHRSKQRNCCGLTMVSPNSSRFSLYLQSRILQKFPFLVEVFYWIITYLFYRLNKVVSHEIFSKIGIWDVAQDHGLAMLEFEQSCWLSILFPVTEHDFQQRFMHVNQTALTVLN